MNINSRTDFILTYVKIRVHIKKLNYGYHNNH